MAYATGFGKREFRTLIGMLVATGLIAVVGALFGTQLNLTESFLWRAVIADLYLVVALVAQHRWLRITAWIATCVTFLAGILNAVWQLGEFGKGPFRYAQVGVTDDWQLVSRALEVAGHVFVIGLLLLSFVSLIRRWLTAQPGPRRLYVLTLVLGLGATAAFSALVFFGWADWGYSYMLTEIVIVLLILPITLIGVTIAAVVNARTTSKTPGHAADTHAAAETASPETAAEGAVSVEDPALGEEPAPVEDLASAEDPAPFEDSPSAEDPAPVEDPVPAGDPAPAGDTAPAPEAPPAAE